MNVITRYKCPEAGGYFKDWQDAADCCSLVPESFHKCGECGKVYSDDIDEAAKCCDPLALERCPFCRGDIIHQADGEHLPEDTVALYCRSCFAVGPHAATKEEAINRWNLRLR